MYSLITDQSSFIDESITKAIDLVLPISKHIGSTSIGNLKDLSKTDTDINKGYNTTPTTTPTDSLNNYFETPVITDGNIPNIENQVFDSSIGKFTKKNDTNKSNTSTPIVYHRKKTHLRDNDEILINHFIKNSINSYILPPNSIALIRINNNYKVLSCKSSNEFELIKNLHSIMYNNDKHFNLEFEMVEEVNIGYLEGELDNYGFLKYDDIQEDLSIIGENLKQLANAKKTLGYKVNTPKDNIINVMPSFQTVLNSNTNEIEGNNIFKKNIYSEDYASIDPSYDTKRTMDLWYNHMFMNGFITEWESTLKLYNISNEYVKKLGYFKEISIYKYVDIDCIVIQELENLFNTELFNDKTQFQEKVDMILTRNNKSCPNLLKIKQYIIDNYNLDNDVEHRIQFTTLLNEVCKGLNVSSEYTEMMKKSLPLVLVELNLNKKRYSSGFFWYGLVKKINTDPSNFISNISVIGKKPDNYPLFPIKTKDKEQNKLEQNYKDIVASRGYTN